MSSEDPFSKNTEVFRKTILIMCSIFAMVFISAGFYMELNKIIKLFLNKGLFKL